MGRASALMAGLLDSPHVGVDVRPDVRRGVLIRRTFRAFERRPVEASERRSVLEAARWAWSAPDAEPVRFILLDDPALKRALQRLTRESKDISNHWEGLFKPAGLRGYVQYWNTTPFCIAVCADPRGGPRHIHDGWNAHIASAAACQNLARAARGQGMALVMYTHFSQEKLKRPRWADFRPLRRPPPFERFSRAGWGPAAVPPGSRARRRACRSRAPPAGGRGPS